MSYAPVPNRTGSSIVARTRAGLVGLLVLAGSLLFVACGTGATAPSATPTASPTPASADALQSDFVNVVRRVSPSVVVIETANGLGSGVVFNTNGDILTNDHVVTGSSKFTVTFSDGQKLPGTLVGQYPAGDLAVIHVTATNLKPGTFGDSSKLVVGDIVLAVGNPARVPGPAVDVAIVGARSPEQIRQTAPAADLRLSPGDLAHIDLILYDEVAVGGPAPEAMPRSESK